MNNELYHYGVLGMKWGVRRYQPYGEGGYNPKNKSGFPMTKRQAKKAIKNAKRAERKRSGRWMSTGENDARVREQLESELENDKELTEISKRRDALDERINKSEAIISEHEKNIERANTMKAHLRDVQNDPNASRDIRREVERHYLSDMEAAKKSREIIDKERVRLQKNANKYDIENNAYHKRIKEIGKRYTNSFKEAAVKDLGIDDIQLGIQMLEAYGLMEKATRMRWKI